MADNLKLSHAEQEAILEEAANALKLDVHISHMGKKRELVTEAERIMGHSAHESGKPYKKSWLWCDTVEVCFYFTGKHSATAAASFTSVWLAGTNDLKARKAVNAVQKVEDMLDLMQQKANEVMLEKVVKGGAPDEPDKD